MCARRAASWIYCDKALKTDWCCLTNREYWVPQGFNTTPLQCLNLHAALLQQPLRRAQRLRRNHGPQMTVG